MKKTKLLIICIITTIFILSGCGESIKNEYGETVAKLGPYIEISREEGTDPKDNTLIFITVYEEETHIVHRITHGRYKYNDIYLYSYDNEGHPVLQFYEEGKIITK